jgi:hypothetical protein
MKFAAIFVSIFVALIAALWIAFVRAPPPHEVCARKADILRAEAGDDHGDAVERLLDQYRLGCRKQAEALLKLRGKLVYARHAKCVRAARTLSDAERCGG